MYIFEYICTYLHKTNIRIILKFKMAPLYTTKFTIEKFNALLRQSIYVFCMDLRTNSDYFPVQH